MSRVTGYAGVINSQGAKFLASDRGRAVRCWARRRGAGSYVVDNGADASSRSRARSRLERARRLRAATCSIDRNPTREAIEREFAALEDARQADAGSAIGVAAAFPVTIDRVSAWAASLEQKGIALVPVSALIDARPLCAAGRRRARRRARSRGGVAPQPREPAAGVADDPQPFERRRIREPSIPRACPIAARRGDGVQPRKASSSWGGGSIRIGRSVADAAGRGRRGRRSARGGAARARRRDRDRQRSGVWREAPEWFSYDLPRDGDRRGARRAKYRGQRQKWFALRFSGADSEIDLERATGTRNSTPVAGSRSTSCRRLIVPFKRDVYDKVVEAFRHCQLPGVALALHECPMRSQSF